MVKEWDITIPQLTGERTRRAYVYVPAGYEEEQDRRYPVMYMFDGHNLFFDEEATYGKSWGIGEYLDYTNTKLIIAAVECNTVGNGRLEEYSPVNFYMPDGTFIRGKGKKYMDWLVGEFKPFIDENFLTLPDRENTSLGGSSMGGIMALYAVTEYNSIFSRAAALSPSLWVSPKEFDATLDSAKLGPATAVYMDYGAREFSNHSAMRAEFAHVCTRLLERHVLLTARVIPGGEHCEASWERQLPFAIPVLMFGL